GEGGLAKNLKNAGPRKHEPLVLELIPENLLREPIEYIFADHYRMRQVMATMDRFLSEGIYAQPPTDDDVKADMAVIRDYLRDELPPHIADEEEDLFPCLERNSPGDSDTKQILATLHQEHEEDFALLPPLIAGHDDLLAGKPVAKRDLFETSVIRFVETQRRHIIWENNIVLPLARRRLSAEDMEQTGRDMAARRGLEYPA
ncbi:MAG: hemerythrin domain-containing protein, partial [Alphaproteobacteria bacterium]|nr:hemerythrin domain-containing protein [Alphaproteobacteria bacterium]